MRWKASLAASPPLDSTTSLGSSRWHHIAVVIASGRHALYFDGKLAASRSETKPLDRDLDIPLTVGAWIGDGASFATATVDDLAVWDAPLGPEQIAALAASKTVPKESVPDPKAAAAVSRVRTGSPALDKALWIWASPQAITAGEPMSYFRKEFELPAAPNSASILITVDNDYDLYVN
ncbi:MAG: LamG domain-containing protein, partial [bacterium]|nr:LamG domain-containing protein [bacterium]